MQDANGVFAQDYAEARGKFVAAAASAGATMQSYDNPAPGPRGETLATDTAWLGPEDAGRLLVLISATHGVEGFCGSAAQIDWLRQPELPKGCAALLIHAINPYGFAWLRRVSEEGVDLNRNFIDFSRPPPENAGYDALADAILPADLTPETLANCMARLAAYEKAHGRTAFEEALSAGQYRHPLGLFYGGTGPTWSRRTTETIISHRRLAGRQRVAVIDLHTGLGPYGYGEPICDHAPGSTGARLARCWYGESLTEPALGTSSSVAKFGLADYGWQQLVGDSLVYIALEFGTYPFARMLAALRADHWLHLRGDPDWSSAQTRRIKADIRKYFYPDTADWKEMVLFRARQVIAQALAGLRQEN